MYRQTADVGGRPDAVKQGTVAVVFPAIRINGQVAAGIAWGVVAWLAYGLVEYVLCCILPLLSMDRAVFVPLNWSLTAWLFNAYWFFGAVAGGICGALFAYLPGGAASGKGARNSCGWRARSASTRR